MDFLKSIGSTLADWGKSLGSTLSDVFNNGNANLAGLGASTYAGGSPLSPTNDPVQTAVNTANNNAFVATNGQGYMTPVPQSVKNQSNVQNALKMIQNPQGSIATPQYFQAQDNMNSQINNILANAPQGQFTPAKAQTPFDVTAYRNALPGVTGGQTDTRVSNSDVGVPYYDAFGNLVTPKSGFSGLSGSGSSIGSFASPTVGQSGQTGSGGSAFTGTLSGTGGLGTPGITNTDNDPNNPKSKAAMVNQAATSTSPVPAPVVPGSNVGANGQIAPNGTTNYAAGAGTAQMPGSSLVQPGSQLPGSVPSTVNVGDIQSISGALDKLVNNPSSFNSNDLAALNQNMQTTFQTAYQKYSQLNPTLPQGVVNDPSQTAAVNASQDPYGIQQIIDNLKTSDTQLMQLQANRNDLNNQLTAITDTYKSVVTDIKADSSLPAAIKQKRLDYVLASNKDNLQTLTNAITTIDQDISVRNESVNRQLGIANLVRSTQQQQQQTNTEHLKMLIDSGAVGGLTDSELKTWANATGMSTSDLENIRATAKNPNLTTQVVGNSTDGYYLASFNAKTGEPAKTVPIIAGKSSTTGSLPGGLTIDQYAESTASGNKYINYDKLTAAEKSSVGTAARAAGIPILKAQDVSKLNAIDETRDNLANIKDSVQTLLAKTPGLNITQGLSNSFQSALGVQGIKDYNAYRTAIINSVQALAGGAGSGLRINQAEIQAAMENDLPVISGFNADTLGSAQGKLDKLGKQLDNWEQILVGKAPANQQSSGTTGGSSSDPLGLFN